MENRLRGKYSWSLRVQSRTAYCREFNYISGGSAYWQVQEGRRAPFRHSLTQRRKKLVLLLAASVVQRQRAGLWYPSSRVRTRPKPSDFQGEKILSTPSFGGEVKPSVPCRSFTACKRCLNVTCKSEFRQNYWTFLAHSSTFRRWVLSRGDTRGDAWSRSHNKP